MAPGTRSPFDPCISRRLALASCLALALLLPATGLAAPPPTPVPSPDFTITTFAGPLAGSTAPELHRGRRETRLGRLRQQRKPRWQRGAKSQIVEYSSAGKVKRNLTVTGHNDGLRFDPTTHQLWALQNEDANPSLLVIDPITGFTVQYTFAAKPSHGGYDDMVFTNGAVYLSASNPTLDAKGNSIGPSIVRATLVAASHTVEVTPVVSGTPQRREHPVRHGQPAQSHRPGLDDSHTLRRDPAG